MTTQSGAPNMEALLDTPPDDTMGTPLGPDGWKFVVQLGAPNGDGPDWDALVTALDPLHAIATNSDGDIEDTGSATTTYPANDPVGNQDGRVFMPWSLADIGVGFIDSPAWSTTNMDWETDSTHALYFQFLLWWVGPDQSEAIVADDEQVTLLSRGGPTDGQALRLTENGILVLSHNVSGSLVDRVNTNDYDDVGDVTTATYGYYDEPGGTYLGPGIYHIGGRIARTTGKSEIWVNGRKVASGNLGSIADGTGNIGIGYDLDPGPLVAPGSDTAISMPGAVSGHANGFGIGYVMLDVDSGYKDDSWFTDYYDEFFSPYFEWIDITDEVRGVEFDFGSTEVLGPVRAGSLKATLESPDGRWDPFNASPDLLAGGEPGAGLLIRVGIVEDATGSTFDDGWVPLWTGVVEEWIPTWEGAGADQVIEITAYETPSQLSLSTGNLRTDLMGGVWLSDQCQSLLRFASWPFGHWFDSAQNSSTNGFASTVNATDFSANRLAEAQLYGMAIGNGFARSDRKGHLLYQNWENSDWDGNGFWNVDTTTIRFPLRRVSTYYSEAHGAIGFRTEEQSDSDSDAHTSAADEMLSVAYDVDGTTWGPSRDNVVNQIKIENPDSSPYGDIYRVALNRFSIAKWGVRAEERTDQINESQPQLQYIAKKRIRWGAGTAYAADVTVHPVEQSDAGCIAALAVDYGARAFFFPPLQPGTDWTLYLEGRVSNVVHRVSPGGDRCVWEAVYHIEGLETFGLGTLSPPTNEDEETGSEA